MNIFFGFFQNLTNILQTDRKKGQIDRRMFKIDLKIDKCRKV